MPYYIQGPDGKRFLVTEDIHPKDAGAQIASLYDKGKFLGPSNAPTLPNEIGSGLLGGIDQLEAGAAGLLPIAGKAAQGVKNIFTGAHGTDISDASQSYYEKHLKPYLEQQQFQTRMVTPTDTGLVGQGLRMAGGLLPIAAAGIVDPLAPVAAMGLSGAGQHVQEANAAGKPVDTAGTLGAGAVQAALGSLPLGIGGKFAEDIASPLLRKAAKVGIGAGVGGVGFGGAQVASNLIDQNTINPNQPLFQGVGQAALQGGLFGGVHGLLAKAAAQGNAPPPDIAPPLPETPQGPMQGPQQMLALPAPDTNYVPAEPGQININPNQREPVKPYGAPGEMIPAANKAGLSGLADVGQPLTERAPAPSPAPSTAPEMVGLPKFIQDEIARPVEGEAGETPPSGAAETPVAAGAPPPAEQTIPTPESIPAQAELTTQSSAPIEPTAPLPSGPFRGPAEDPGRAHPDQAHADLYRLGDMATSKSASRADLMGEAQSLASSMGRFMDWSDADLKPGERKELDQTGVPPASAMLRVAKDYAADFNSDGGGLSLYDPDLYPEALKAQYARGREQSTDVAAKQAPEPEAEAPVAGGVEPDNNSPSDIPSPTLGSQMRGDIPSETNRAGPAIISDMRDKVQTELNRLGMSDVSSKLVGNITPDTNSPYGAYGSFHPDAPMGKLITLAHDVYEPGITDEQLGSRVMGTLNHEVIHALRSLDVLRPDEWGALEREAARRPDASGNTYQSNAEQKYPDLDADGQKEEAIAEMFRDWRDSGGKVNNQPTGILNRLFRMVKGLFRGLGRANADDIFSKIESGDVGARPRGSGGLGAQNAPRAMSMTPPGAQVGEAVIKQYDALRSALAKIPGMGDVKARQLLMNLQDQQLPIAEAAKWSLSAGDMKISEEDPRMLQVNGPGLVQHVLKSYRDNFAAPIAKLVKGSGVTDGMLKDLERRVPNTGYVGAIKGEHPNISPMLRAVNAVLYADHAPERNSRIENIVKAKYADGTPVRDGSGMSNEEAAAVKQWQRELPQHVQDRIQAVVDKAQGALEFTRQQRVSAGLDFDWKGDVLPKLQSMKEALTAKINDPSTPEKELNAAKGMLAGVDRSILKIPNYDHYVPVRGQLAIEHADDPFFGEEGGGGASGGYTVQGREDPYALGRASYADDILGNIHQLAVATVERAQKNKLDQSIEDALGRVGGEIPGFAKMVEDDPSRPGRQQVPMVKGRNDTTGEVQMQVDPHWRDQDSPYLIFKRGGEERWMQILAPEARDALKGTPLSGSTKFLANTIGALTRLMSHLAVNVNPAFAPTLAFRHTSVAALYAGRYDETAWKDIWGKTASYFSDLATNPERAKSRLAALGAQGAQSGLLTTRGIDNQVKEIQSEFNLISNAEQDHVSLATRGQMAASYMNKTAHFLQAINNHAEWSTRVGVYETFLDRGYSPARAAQIARELTIDFDRHGTWGSSLGSLYMFANATLQDAGALGGAIVSSKRVQAGLAALAAAGLAEAPLAYMMGGQDKDGNYSYDKISDAQKARSIIIMAPWADGGYLRLPVLYGPAAFYEAGRNMFAVGKGTKSIPTAIGDTAMNFVNSFSIIGDTSAGLLHAVTPSVLRPAEEVATNTPWYGSGVIHPEISAYGEGMAPSQIHKTTTSTPFIAASNALHALSGGSGQYGRGKIEIPPDDLQYLFNQHIGGLGQNIMRMAELPGKIANPQREAAAGRQLSAGDVPILGSFMGSVTPASTRAAYETLATPVIQTYHDFTAATKNGDQTAAAAIVAKDPGLFQTYSGIETVEDQRRDVNSLIKALNADTTMSASQKQSQIIAARQQLDAATQTELAILKKSGVKPQGY